MQSVSCEHDHFLQFTIKECGCLYQGGDPNRVFFKGTKAQGVWVFSVNVVSRGSRSVYVAPICALLKCQGG